MRLVAKIYLLSFICFLVVHCNTPPKGTTENPGSTEPENPAPQQSTPPAANSVDDFLKPANLEEAEKIYAKYRTIEKYLQSMDEVDDRTRLLSVEELKKVPGVVEDASNLYRELTGLSERGEYAYLHEARWRVVHLLGDLRDPKAGSLLRDISLTRLPNPKQVPETTFSAEYRIRSRAVAGLEKLEAIDLLQEIYRAKNLLSGQAAASLFELGQPPRGVVNLDTDKVMGKGDPADFKRNPANEDRGGGLRIPAASDKADTSTVIVPKN